MSPHVPAFLVYWYSVVDDKILYAKLHAPIIPGGDMLKRTGYMIIHIESGEVIESKGDILRLATFHVIHGPQIIANLPILRNTVT